MLKFLIYKTSAVTVFYFIIVMRSLGFVYQHYVDTGISVLFLIVNALSVSEDYRGQGL